MRINPDNKKIRYSGRIDWRNPKEPIWVYPCTSAAVSYTHLDVYKRQVRDCFSSYAEKMHTTVEENASEEHEMGHVFSFSDPSVDEYCYCVEENEFGLTYHRISREDYEDL